MTTGVPPAAAARLREGILEFTELPDSEWRFLEPNLVQRDLSKGAYLVREGQRHTMICVVLEGLLKTFVTDDGKERVRNLAWEGRFLSAYDCVLTGEGSLFGIQALEPSRLLGFDGRLLGTLYRRHACWERLGRRIAEELWLDLEKKEKRERLMSAEERYLRITTRWPALLERTPLKDIASYLGIEPETLSRIRRRCAARRNDSP